MGPIRFLYILVASKLRSSRIAIHITGSLRNRRRFDIDLQYTSGSKIYMSNQYMINKIPSFLCIRNSLWLYMTEIICLNLRFVRLMISFHDFALILCHPTTRRSILCWNISNFPSLDLDIDRTNRIKTIVQRLHISKNLRRSFKGTLRSSITSLYFLNVTQCYSTSFFDFDIDTIISTEIKLTSEITEDLDVI